jgi:hypothetical protein
MRVPAFSVVLLKTPCSEICRAHSLTRPMDSRPVLMSCW